MYDKTNAATFPILSSNISVTILSLSKYKDQRFFFTKVSFYGEIFVLWVSTNI